MNSSKWLLLGASSLLKLWGKVLSLRTWEGPKEERITDNLYECLSQARHSTKNLTKSSQQPYTVVTFISILQRRKLRLPEIKHLTKVIKPSGKGIAGTLTSWIPKSRLLTTKLQPTFQNHQERRKGRDGKAAEEKDEEKKETGHLQSCLGALSTATPALGEQRKVPDICGSGRSGLVRDCFKVKQQGFKHALGTSAC